MYYKKYSSYFDIYIEDKYEDRIKGRQYIANVGAKIPE